MDPLPVSPLAPDSFPDLPAVAGVRLAAMAAGLRYRDRYDLLLVELAAGTTVAGVLTRSLCPSAPVDWCRKILPRGSARALVVNAGNANAFSGKTGEQAVQTTVAAAKRQTGCSDEEVFVASTGVIGAPLDGAEIAAALPKLRDNFGQTTWQDAANAICTTDTFPKGCVRVTEIDGVPVSLVGIAKGSGMIQPDMATMLAFLFTDAALPAALLQDLLSDINQRSFNAITVDSDTSTSDTALLFATAQAGNAPISDIADPRLDSFRAALTDVMTDLAHQIVRDGEGAQKFISITVTGAEHDAAARVIGLSVANSPLVKTAIAGEDANWGRIIMAVGKAGQKADRDQLVICIGGQQVTEGGFLRPEYDEAAATRHLQQRDIMISIDVGVGDGVATVWTCDLTHGYIDINADYRS